MRCQRGEKGSKLIRLGKETGFEKAEPVEI